MSLIIAEEKIPALAIAHLIARRTDADYPTPAADVLNLTPGPVKVTAKAHPSLVIWCSGFEFNEQRDSQVVTVMLDLHAHQATALSTELGWLASIRRSFAGGPTSKQANASTAATNPFLAYLNALSSGDKEGWEIRDFHITGGQTLILEGQRVVYRTTGSCTFRSYVFTV